VAIYRQVVGSAWLYSEISILAATEYSGHLAQILVGIDRQIDLMAGPIEELANGGDNEEAEG
jgi:hypothetical protein